MHLLIMIIELSDFRGYFANLPASQAVLGVKNLAMLLLKLPELGINIERPAKVCLPLPMSVLR